MVSKGNAKGTQAQITSYYDPKTVQALRSLSEATGEPQSELLREALTDLLAKYGWRSQLSGAFGVMDVKFGVHPADTKRAKAVIAEARAAGASFEDLEKEVVWHCYKEAPALRHEHTVEQVKRAKELWGKPK